MRRLALICIAILSISCMVSFTWADDDDDEVLELPDDIPALPVPGDITETVMEVRPDDDRAAAATPQPATMPAGIVKQVSVLGDGAFRHDDDIASMLVLPDGKRVLTSGSDGTARLWDIKSGRRLQTYRHSGQYVWDVALLPDGKRFLGAGSEGVVLWEIDTGKRLAKFPQKGMVFRIAVDPAGSFLAAGNNNSSVTIWDVATQKSVATLKHGGDVYTQYYDADGKHLITACSNSGIRKWDSRTGARTGTLKSEDKNGPDGEPEVAGKDPGRTGDIFTLAPCADKSRVMVCCEARGPWLMDASSGKELWQAKDATACYCAAWSPDGNSIAALAKDKLLFLLDAKTGAVKWQADLGEGTHYGVAFTPDGSEILCGVQNVLIRYDARTGSRVYPAPDKPLLRGSLKSLKVCNTSTVLDTCDGKLRSWDRKTGRCTMLLPDKQIVAADTAGRGEVMVVGWASTVALIDSKSGKVLRTLQNGKDNVAAVAMSSDGKLALALSDNCVGVWSVQSGKSLAALSISRGGNESDFDNGLQSIEGFALGSDGTLVVTASSDGLAVWSLPDGTLVRSLKGLTEARGCAMSPGDTQRVLGWNNKTLAMWTMSKRTFAPMTPKDFQDALARLGADKFAVREKATRQLIDAGESVLPMIAKVQNRSAEVGARLARVQRQIAASRAEYGLCKQVPLREGLTSLSFHPDGKHFVAIQGEVPNRRLLIGIAADDDLRILGGIELENQPSTALFDANGSLLLGNCNGTISICEMKVPS